MKKLFNKNNNKIVLYTAIFNQYDELIEPPKGITSCDFICFTDNINLQSETYKIIYIKNYDLDPVRQARKFKILTHRYLPQYEYSVWIDANLRLKKTDLALATIDLLKNHDLAIFNHGERDCIYEEAKECIRLAKDNKSVIENQIDKYRKIKYPQNNGLVSSSLIFRRTLSPELIEFSEKWWDEVKNLSRRDQLSFNYVAWRNNFKYNAIFQRWMDNEYYELYPHSSGGKAPVEDENNKLTKKCCSQKQVSSLQKTIIEQSEELDKLNKIIIAVRESRLWKTRNKIAKTLGRGQL